MLGCAVPGRVPERTACHNSGMCRERYSAKSDKISQEKDLCLFARGFDTLFFRSAAMGPEKKQRVFRRVSLADY